MVQIYNDPAGGSASTIGTQFRTDYYKKKALIEARKETYFGQLADVTNMPKNMGKTIKCYHYLPLLDDANINDQGLDAAGAAVTQSVTIVVTRADGGIPNIPNNGRSVGNAVHFVGDGANAAAAEDAAVNLFMDWATSDVLGGGLAASEANSDGGFATAVQSGGTVYDAGYRASQPNGTLITVAASALEAQSVPQTGNLYGSSKDIGAIAAKLPVLSETGGRVNRVGFKRREIEGTIAKFGFFDEYTQESMDFDTDSELQMHINREMVSGANQMTEAALQIDLLNGAGVVRFGGSATSTATVTGVSGPSIITYNDLLRMNIDLDNNRTPKNTKIISGTRMVDTRVVNAARYMYVGAELTPSLKALADTFSNQAFISVEKYANAGMVAVGEIGSIDQFRVIVVPEMLHWAGAGAAEGTNTGYRTTGGNYDVYPMLIVGSESFTTIGFQTDGKTVKFSIKHAKPGSTESFANDPYGETGFMSIKWYYGSMILRPERIGLFKVACPW